MLIASSSNFEEVTVYFYGFNKHYLHWAVSIYITSNDIKYILFINIIVK